MSDEKKRVLSLRNKRIIVGWARHGMSVEFLAGKHNISTRRVNQIINGSHSFIKAHKENEKAKRINIIGRLIDSKRDTSHKDIVDLLEYQRKEIEGDERQAAGETKIIIIRSDSVAKPESNVIERTISL